MVKTNKNTGFVIQARSGSTRMPDKMLRPFFKEKSILEILLDRFKKEAEGIPFVIATTTNPLDDRIENLANTLGVKCFRGSEEDVLFRFIETAHVYGFNSLIRVCADNPLFDIAGTLKLVEYAGGSDYTAYKLFGEKPSISTHSGFWGELVQLEVLERVTQHTTEKKYREHVTNFIYTHPDLFQIKLIEAPNAMFKRDDIRLTVDTMEDWKMVLEIYSKLQESGLPVSIPNILNLVDNNPDFLMKMKTQIALNSK